jgi:2-dehydro-3-deoxyphosphooctonate aldolase (KDO 8-P synthase)
VRVGSVDIGNAKPLTIIAGPCALESRAHALEMANALKEIARNAGVGLIYKTSFDKANRTSAGSERGIGLDQALPIFAEIRETAGLPVLTDVHEREQCAVVAEVADILQIPAFLCRQTDLLLAAGATGKIVNIKKGQFLAPEDIGHQAEKVASTGNKKILLTERGATFGYHNLVVDMRSLAIMRATGYPVILDATHSVQLPGGEKAATGGQPEFIFPIARAGVAVGIDGLFVETHPDPKRAMSDAASQLKLDLLEGLVRQVVALDSLVKKKFGL